MRECRTIDPVVSRNMLDFQVPLADAHAHASDLSFPAGLRVIGCRSPGVSWCARYAEGLMLSLAWCCIPGDALASAKRGSTPPPDTRG